MASFGLARWAKTKAAQAFGLKQAGQAFFPQALNWFMQLPRSNYNYASEIGDGLASSSVMPVVQWIMRVFPEARLIVEAQDGDEWALLPQHPMLALMNRPNPWYDGGILWMATVYSWCWFGESFWRILSNRGGEPAELWWLPNWSVIPQASKDGRTFIDEYTYTPTGHAVEHLLPEQVVHFRHGIDPRNPIHGLPPLRSILREIWSDEEASNFVASLLRNSAVTSTLITPDPQAGEGVVIGEEQAELIKAYVMERFTGDNKGLPMVLNGPLKVQRLGFAPNELDLSVVRDIAEERVCAALGIPAVIVGFGTGLQQTRVGATMLQEAMMAWTNGLIPMQRIMGATLAQKLLPMFEDTSDKFRLDWDYSKVRALQEDEAGKATRLTSMVQGGWYRVDEARTAMGLESEDSDHIYLRSFSVVEVPQGQAMERPAPALTLVPPDDDEEDEEDEDDEAAEARAMRGSDVRRKGRGRLVTKADSDALFRLADRLEPQMRGRFLAAVQRTKQGIDPDMLEAALRSFDPDLAVTAIPWETFSEAFGPDATGLMRQAIGQSGALAARQVPGTLGIAYRFDLNNPAAIQWAEQHAGRMIRGVRGRTETAIRELVAQSLRGEWTWQQVSRQVRTMVGLTEQQALAVQRFEAQLRRDGVPADRISARTERYAAAQLRDRAETIARTEIMTAENMGQQLAWESAMREGYLDRESTFKTWIIAEDERLCPVCEALDGAEVLLHEAFAGGFLQPPAHPQCRCATGLVFHDQAAEEIPLGAVAD